jgi:glutamate-1-semialdehyde aminotransferase
VKIVAIVQARMGSTRLPNKVMKAINSIPMIGILLERLALSKKIEKIILATSDKDINKPLIEYVISQGYVVETGSENNVLERFYLAAKKHHADIIVRITGDCPLIDSEVVDDVIALFLENNLDYSSNVNPPTFPDGLDVEVISFNSLENAYKNTTIASDQEHVTPFIRKNQSNQLNYAYKDDHSNLRWTVDEEEDFILVKKIFDNFHPDTTFSWKDALSFYENNDLISINNHLTRNQGSNMGKGQKLYKRAKQIIPGGNMLLSKRPEMFLPNLWPSYFSKSKGCKVWDLEGKEYVDMSIMGIGTNILGYGHEEVDAAVKQTIEQGNMSTWNCPEEVYLAEKLIEINPWADMVRFARTGGEANAIAVRIARAASGKGNVAICGYHGWHDWYLAVNINAKDGLNSHLLPGLEAQGVPKELGGTVFPFHYNNFAELEKTVNDNNIGVIKMEVVRNDGPEDNFLQKVRDLATQKGIVLIFDECTSGFRETNGGIHQKYNVEPDIAMYGKALGNGYAITAIVGRKEVMQSAQNTFISSTFWTERIGPSAALKTLEVMDKIKAWEKISATGENIKLKWTEIALKYEIAINMAGISALPSFTFSSQNHLAYKTFITQEMLKKNFIANTSIYVCIEHSNQLIDEYMGELEKIFIKIKECEDGRDINDLLDGPVCHSGFQRLN